MHSCIYEGQVAHRRYGQTSHAFRYGLFLMYLDLNELDELFARRWLWSTRRPAVGRFCRDDHLGDPRQPLANSVGDLVETETGRRPAGPIRLLTHLRYFGYVINPVSFYFCFDADDREVETVVAEVNNTPWGERHCYVIPAEVALEAKVSGGRKILRAEHDKEFHVSPFLPMDMQYRWQIETPAEQFAVRIANYRDGERQFSAELNLSRRSITTWQLARVLLRYPLMTARVTAGIYWQALRLWWKGAKFYPHPKQRDSATPTPRATQLT